MITTRKRTRGHRTSRAGCRAGTSASIERRHRARSRERVAVQGSRIFFSGRICQHMKTSWLVDCLAAGALVFAVAAWGALVSLLGS